MARITGVAGQRLLGAFLDGLDGEMAADRRPASGAEGFEDDIGVRKDSDFLYVVRTSKLERCGEVVLSEQLSQTA